MQIMKTFLPNARTSTLNTSRRHFILGSAAVAGSGLALGLPAAWSLSVDALRPKTVDAIKQTTFTSEDVKLIQRRGWCALWEDVRAVEKLGGGLHPISSDLLSQTLRFFDEPARITDICCDISILMEIMKDGGRLVEWSAGLNESYLSVEAIADRVRALWAHAHESGPLVASKLVILVLAHSDDRSLDRWRYLSDSLDDSVGDDPYIYDRYWYLESNIGAGETAAVSLWIGEGER